VCVAGCQEEEEEEEEKPRASGRGESMERPTMHWGAMAAAMTTVARRRRRREPRARLAT